MQAPRFPRAGDFAGPNVQPIGVLSVQTQLLEALLNPLPILLALLPGQRTYLRVLLRIPLEHAWADQVSGVADGMYKGLCVVDDQTPRGYAILQPRHEVLARRLRSRRRRRW